MPGGISINEKEKEYEKISKQRMNKNEYHILKNYYSQSINNTEEMLGRKLTWLDF